MQKGLLHIDITWYQALSEVGMHTLCRWLEQTVLFFALLPSSGTLFTVGLETFLTREMSMRGLFPIAVPSPIPSRNSPQKCPSHREVAFFSISGLAPGFLSVPRPVLGQNGLNPPYFVFSRPWGSGQPKRKT